MVDMYEDEDCTTALQRLAWDMEEGCLPALMQAVAYCVEHSIPLPVEFVHMLAQQPELGQLRERLDDRHSRPQMYAIRAAAFEVAEDHLGVDLFESTDGINKKQVAECVAELLPKHLHADIKTLVNWWYVSKGGAPTNRTRYKDRFEYPEFVIDHQWWKYFARELKLF